MKNLRNFALAAFALLGFAACQQEEFAPEIKNPTHSVTFVAGAPETKTTVTIDGNTAKFAWTEKDVEENRISVYENDNAASTVVCGLDDKTGKMTIMAEFKGTATGNETYVAVVNSSNDGQIMSAEAYDEDADILVSKAVSTFDGENGVQLQFKREVAIAKMTLKGLDAGEVVNHVTVSSTADIAGSYGLDGWNSTKTSLDIYSAKALDDQKTYSIAANQSGEAVVWFTCIPQDAATLTVKVEAADGDTYTKEFSKPITLTRGDVKGFGVAMTKDAKVTPSYTIEFNSTAKTVTDISNTTKATTFVVSGSDYLTEQPASNYSKAYYGGSTDGLPLRIGTSSAAGTITLALSEAGQVPATKIILSAKQYSSGKTKVIGVNGSDKQQPGDDYTDLSYDLDGTTITSIKLDTDGYIYVKSITVEYSGTIKTALKTPANLAVSAAKMVSWDAVSGAASYEITIGKDVFTSETNSYDATTVVDDYYDVAVVAIPSDKENYKNSAAATLSGVKFGTPTLAMPTLKEGVVDGASISVSWTVDERATAGYNCELFKGEVKVGEGQIVKVGTVTFTGLDAETAYVVKVNAIAVEGAKAYAASPVATLEVTTKAASATANDGSLERPYTAAEAIAAIDANTGLTGKYVKGIVKATPSFNATYKSLTYDIVSGEATLYIYSGRDLGDADFVGAEDLKAGDEVIVFGTLKKYNTTYELDKENYLISVNGKTEICRGLAVSEPKIAFNVGDAFEFGGKVLQIWRGKEDVDVTTTATFSGYNMSKEGKQTVTVKVGEETVAYEITVNPAGAALPITISKKISDMSGNPTDGTKVSSMTMDDVITLSASTTGNNGKVYGDGKEWRLYQSDSGTMTVSSKAGYAIESITVTFNSRNTGTLLYNNNVVTSGKAVEVSGSSVKFTLGNSGTATNGQIRITAISVTYKQQ